MTTNIVNTGVKASIEGVQLTATGTSPEITEVAGKTTGDAASTLNAAREEKAAAYAKVAEYLDTDLQLKGEVVKLYSKNNGILSYKGSEYYFALLGNDRIDFGDMRQGMSVKFTVKQDPRRGFQGVATAFIAELNPALSEEKDILASRKANHMHMIHDAQNPEMVEKAIVAKTVFSWVVRNISLTGEYGTIETDGAVVNFDIRIMDPESRDEFIQKGISLKKDMPVRFTLVKSTSIPRTDNYFILASIQGIGSTEKPE